MAIVLAIGLPSFSKITTHFQVEGEILGLKNDLLFARNKSILDGIAYKVSFQPESNKYSIIKSGTIPTIIKTEKLSQQLDIIETSLDDDQVFFSSTGAPNQGGTIYIKDIKGKAIDIIVTIATGKVNVKYY